MNPPIETSLALVELSLDPLVASLSSVRSFDEVIICLRDTRTPQLGGVIAHSAAKVSSRRLTFSTESLIHRAVDLSTSTLGETFASKKSSLQPNNMNPSQLVWGTFLALPGKHEAVVQIAFSKSAAKAPTITTIEKVWEESRHVIEATLSILSSQLKGSIIDQARLDAPVSPNAAVIVWDVIDANHIAHQTYGEFNHFLTTFKTTIEPIIAQYGGTVTYANERQEIIIPIPSTVDIYSHRSVASWVNASLIPLLNAIETAHETIGQLYEPVMRIRVGVGIGFVMKTLHGEQSGPILWDVASAMRMRAGTSELFTLCIDTSAKPYITR